MYSFAAISCQYVLYFVDKWSYRGTEREPVAFQLFTMLLCCTAFPALVGLSAELLLHLSCFSTSAKICLNEKHGGRKRPDFQNTCVMRELSLLCRGGEARVLISTDVWARGLDVQQVCASIT